MKDNKKKEYDLTNLKYLLFNAESIAETYGLEEDSNVCEYVYVMKRGISCSLECDHDCDNCHFRNCLNVVSFLNEKYKQINKILVTQFEYNILKSIKETKTIYSISAVGDYALIVKMKEKGYFKNIKLNYNMAYLLEHMEAIKDEKL